MWESNPPYTQYMYMPYKQQRVAPVTATIIYVILYPVVSCDVTELDCIHTILRYSPVKVKFTTFQLHFFFRGKPRFGYASQKNDVKQHLRCISPSE